jgi:drug/metabolite transporter (DMT)-like permease
VSGADTRLGWAALTLGVGGISFTGVFVQLADVGPSALAVYRMVLAMPALLVWMAFEQRRSAAPLTIMPREWLALAFAGAFFAADLITWHYAIRLTGVANAMFIVHLAPIVVVVGARLIFHERITMGFICGMAVALAGVALLMGANGLLGSGDLLGDGLALVAAFAYGGYLLILKEVRVRLPTGTIMAISSGFSCIVLLVAMFVSGDTLVPSSLQGWGMVVAIALVSQAAGQSLITFAFRHLSASLASVALLATPVTATLIAWIVLGETLTLLQGIGCGVILVGIAVAQRFSAAAK